MKKKVCKKCRIFFEGEKCPICGESQTANVWRGRLYIANPEKSIVAKRVGLKVKGEYAIKVR